MPYQLKVILEGTIVLEDADSGNKLTATAGDVLKSASRFRPSLLTLTGIVLIRRLALAVKKGTTVIFSSPDAGRAFYVGQRKLRDF